MNDIRPVIQKTIDTFIENNTLAVKRKDISLFSSMLSHDCVRVYRPLSLVRRYPQFLKPELSNADFETRMKMELQTMQDVSQKVTRTVIDTTQRRASISSELTIITGDDHPHKTVEVIWDLDFTEDGTRISRIFEFVDNYEATAVIEEMLSKAVSSSQ